MKNYILSFSLLFCTAYPASITTELMERAENDDVSFVQLMFTDPIHAKLKEVTIPINQLGAALETGLSFDSSSIEGFGNKEGKDQITTSDMILKIDPNTYRFLPWTSENAKTARFMCDIFIDEQEEYAGSPRTILKNLLEEAKELGYEFVVGPELEFFLTKRTQPSVNVIDQDAYFTAQTNVSLQEFKATVLGTLQEHGIEVEKWHHEVAPGQHEMSIKYCDALQMADQIVLTKHILETMAEAFDLHATFMPKPLFGQNGSGMHLNFSLINSENHSNAFFDPTNQYQLSTVAQQFVAGVLHHLQGITLLINPTVNSYKRLVPGYEAPRTICWGKTNRSSAVRIPLNRGNAHATRAELRSPDPTCNPYLALAAILKAGLEGIKQSKALVAPVDENVFHLTDDQLLARNIRTLPADLSQAIAYFEQSSFAKELCGEQLFNAIIQAKRKELRTFNTHVTDWEIERYF